MTAVVFSTAQTSLDFVNFFFHTIVCPKATQCRGLLNGVVRVDKDEARDAYEDRKQLTQTLKFVVIGEASPWESVMQYNNFG